MAANGGTAATGQAAAGTTPSTPQAGATPMSPFMFMPQGQMPVGDLSQAQ